MKVLCQYYSSGHLTLLEVPVPAPRKGHLRIRNVASLVSIGTEKAMIDLARKSLLGKALARPDWVKQVTDKLRSEGLGETFRQSKARLATPVPLGYSAAGVVVSVGAGVDGFAVNDRVACSGSGYAAHAELLSVPPNMCVPIPDGVSFEEASYVALGGIALEAVRMAKVELGSRVVVIGLGLLGQLAVQILHAAGCHTLGVDIDPAKCQLACELGASRVAVSGRDDVVSLAAELTGGHGADAVIILASTKSNQPLELAAEVSRERGTIVASGLTGLRIPRKVFYTKELDFIVSRAWGPGNYDPDYEDRGMKYPLPYVRWSAQRNMAEFLEMVAESRIRLQKLTTHRFPFEEALRAYDLVLSGKEGTIGVILQYREEEVQKRGQVSIVRAAAPQKPAKGSIGVGVIGAGLYARGTLLPAMQKTKGFHKVGVADIDGLSAKHIAETFGFEYSASNYRDLIEDENVHAVFILTRHDSHANLVVEGLRAGKAVFVEKPLAITPEQLDLVVAAYTDSVREGKTPYLMVGFNRRFAPTARRARRFIGQKAPGAVIACRCNAGMVPADSWVQNREEGGGRIIGEVCHFVDLLQFLTGSFPEKVFASSARSDQNTKDNLCIVLQMDNQAACSIVYTSAGDKTFPREYVEIFAGGVCVIDDFRSIEIVSRGKRRRWRGLSVDRGHVAELTHFFGNLRKGEAAPVPFSEYVATTLATFAIEESLITGQSVTCPSIRLDVNTPIGDQ